MAYTRAVFILDVAIYIDFLEEFLASLKPIYPWLADVDPIDKHWRWADFPEDNNTQKDMLVDWIICEELTRVFYIEVKDHYKNSTFDRVYNDLVTKYNLQSYTRHYLIVPKIYGDAMAYVVRRKNGGLHLHYDCNPPIKRRLDVASPTVSRSY